MDILQELAYMLSHNTLVLTDRQMELLVQFSIPSLKAEVDVLKEGDLDEDIEVPAIERFRKARELEELVGLILRARGEKL